MVFDSVRSQTVNGNMITYLHSQSSERMPLFLSNHDSFAGDRVWNQLGGDIEQYKLAAATYLLASKSPFTYYGEEVGMANAASLSGDHALRTPMSWTADTVTAGFTTGTPFRDLSANVASHNVADEEGVGDSLLEYYRSLLQLRAAYPGLVDTDFSGVPSANQSVLLVSSEAAGFSAVTAINYSDLAQPVSAATNVANIAFTGVFGTTDQVTSTLSSTLDFTVPPRTAVVYVNQP